MTGPIEAAACELLWSLWTELGVPGVTRKHTDVALDLEPLVLFTPYLASSDPRLEELASAWCAQHGGSFLSKWRLRGLSRALREPVAGPFTRFSSELSARRGGPWIAFEPVQVGDLGVVRQVAVRLERPALAPLRARALFGVGARADVVCAGIAAGRRWWSSRDLAGLGYSLRALTPVLDDLVRSGLVMRDDRRQPYAYRWRDGRSPAPLLEAEGLVWTDWLVILRIVARLVAYERAGVTGVLARARAHQVAEGIRPDAAAMLLPELPRTSGEADAPDRLTTWARSLVSELADGFAPPLPILL